MTLNFSRTPEQIHKAIQSKLSKGSDYIDCLVEYCKENDLEIESIAEIIKKSPILKEKIRSEAQERKMLKHDNKARISTIFIE